ncbi:MAG: phage tail assembly protein [Sphingomonas sp.]
MHPRKDGERPAWLTPDNSVKLLVPIDYSEGDQAKKLDRVQLRRLTAAEMLIINQSLPTTEKILQLIETMTGLLRVVTIKLDVVDLDRIDECFGYFREPGSVTGATS